MGHAIVFLTFMELLTSKKIVSNKNITRVKRSKTPKKILDFESEQKHNENLLSELLTDEGKKKLRKPGFGSFESLKSKKFWDDFSRLFDLNKGPNLMKNITKSELKLESTLMNFKKSEKDLIFNKYKGLNMLNRRITDSK